MNNDNNDLPKFNCNQFTSCKDIEDNFPVVNVKILNTIME